MVLTLVSYCDYKTDEKEQITNFLPAPFILSTLMVEIFARPKTREILWIYFRECNILENLVGYIFANCKFQKNFWDKFSTNVD